jgi:hypothetical protein
METESAVASPAEGPVGGRTSAGRLAINDSGHTRMRFAIEEMAELRS